MERYPLSSTMLAHKLQVHLFSQAGWAKISTFLNDLFAEETLCVSDEEYNYTFRISTTVQKTPKGEAKCDSEASSNIDFLGIRMDPNKPDSIIVETKQRSPKSEDKRRSSCAMCGKSMYTRNMKRHIEIMHSSVMNIAKLEYKPFQSKPILNTPNDFNNRHQNDDKGSRSLCPICGRNMYTRNMKRHIEIRHSAGTNGNGIGLDYDSNQSSISKTYENDAQNNTTTSSQPSISQQAPVQISVMPDLPTRNLIGMIVDPLYSGQNTTNMLQYNQSNQSLIEQEQQPKFRYKDVKSKCPICEKEMYGRNIKRHMQVMHPMHDNAEQPIGDPNLRVD